MNRKAIEFLAAVASVVATIIGIAGTIGTLAIDMRTIEIFISLAAVIVALVAGAASVYIARATKGLSRQQRIFISYSREDREKARELRDALTSQGAKVWFDENDLLPGMDWRSSIDAAIESSNTVVAVVSGKVGAHLSEELRTALDRRVPVYAIISSGEPTPEILQSLNVRILRSDQDIQKMATAVLEAH